MEFFEINFDESFLGAWDGNYDHLCQAEQKPDTTTTGRPIVLPTGNSVSVKNTKTGTKGCVLRPETSLKKLKK